MGDEEKFRDEQLLCGLVVQKARMCYAHNLIREIKGDGFVGREGVCVICPILVN